MEEMQRVRHPRRDLNVTCHVQGLKTTGGEKGVEKELISHLWPLLNLKANTKSMDQASFSVFKDVNIITSFHPDENHIARKGTLATLQRPPNAICFLESSHQ